MGIKERSSQAEEKKKRVEGQKGRKGMYLPYRASAKPTEPDQEARKNQQPAARRVPLSRAVTLGPASPAAPPKPARAAIWKGKAPRGSRTRLPPGDSAPPEAKGLDASTTQPSPPSRVPRALRALRPPKPKAQRRLAITRRPHRARRASPSRTGTCPV